MVEDRTSPPELTGMLAKAEHDFRAGEKSALISCMYLCIYFGVPLPDWIREGFCSACQSVQTFHTRSWDDVFGKPPAAGRKAAAKKKHHEIEYLLWRRIEQRPASVAKDDSMFEKVGKEFGVSGSVAKRIYYGAPRNLYSFTQTFLDAILHDLGPQPSADALKAWFNSAANDATAAAASQKRPR